MASKNKVAKLKNLYCVPGMLKNKTSGLKLKRTAFYTSADRQELKKETEKSLKEFTEKMTEEEKAEEYADWFWGASPSERRAIKQAYLAGFKAGKDMAEADLATIAYMQGAERFKTKWHKVADNDYPPCEKGNHTINVLTDCGDIAYYNYDEECWVAEPLSVEIDPPIAWCEIPKYEE